MNQAPFIQAVDDLKVRTLESFGTDFARLVYLASTRDYNTGSYSHQGLEFRFTKPVSEMALETCHEEIFERVARARLEDIVQEMAGYLKATQEEPAKVIESWTAFAPYQLLPPRACHGTAKEFFISNVRFSLALLQADPTLYARSDAVASPRQ